MLIFQRALFFLVKNLRNYCCEFYCLCVKIRITKFDIFFLKEKRSFLLFIL
nr:MAG TPA: hypothetical protein [Caudoviricetes sp.]